MPPDAPRPLFRSAHAGVFAAYAALSAAVTWPFAWRLGSAIPSDVGDPVLNAWILWWNAATVPLTRAWWNAPAFFPAEGVLAFSEHLLGLVPLTSPVIWLTGDPQLAYNLVLLLSFPLSALTAYLLALELTGRRDAAFVAGLVYGFAPYRMAHLAHLQVLASWWMPLALLGLHRYVRHRETRGLVLFGAAWLMQALTNGYYQAFFPVLVALWIAWFIPWRERGRAGRIGLAAIVAALPLVPLVAGYYTIHAHHGLSRRIEAIRSLGADLTSLLNAPSLLVLWGDLKVYHRPEGELFTGATVLLLIGWGIARTVRAGRAHPALREGEGGRPVFAFYLVAAGVMFAFALGPAPTWLGEPLPLPGPYAALLWVPGVESLRVPARFAMLMMLCVSAAAGLAFARVTSGWARARRIVLTAVCSVVVIAETTPRQMPLWDRLAPWDIDAEDVPGALLVVPVLNPLNETAIMYRATAHGRPLVNGYSGHYATWYRTLGAGLNALDPAVLDELARAGVTTIAVVARQDPDGVWADYVRTRASFLRESRTGAFTLYRLPAVPAWPEAGRPLPVVAVTVSANEDQVARLADGDLATRWHSAGPQQGDEVVTVDLGTPRFFTAVELALGSHAFDYPRELAIDASLTGDVWEQVWRGRGEAPSLAGGFRHPRAMPVSVTFVATRARFVRLRQVGQDPFYYWTIAELTVLGPPAGS